MVTGLDLLFLEVNNLEESVAFYHEDLEFEIQSHNPDADPPIASSDKIRRSGFCQKSLRSLSSALRPINRGAGGRICSKRGGRFTPVTFMRDSLSAG